MAHPYREHVMTNKLTDIERARKVLAIEQCKKDARLAQYMAQKRYEYGENDRRERWILVGMIVVGLGTAFLLSVIIQIVI